MFAVAALLALFLRWREDLTYGQAAVVVKVALRALSPVSAVVWIYRARLDASAFPWLQLQDSTMAALVVYAGLTGIVGLSSFMALACTESAGKEGFSRWAKLNSKVKADGSCNQFVNLLLQCLLGCLFTYALWDRVLVRVCVFSTGCLAGQAFGVGAPG
jgi:hypothetical protein